MLRETKNHPGDRGEPISRVKGSARREKQALLEMERMTDLEQMLMARAQKINEGHNGVILKIDLSEPLLIKEKMDRTNKIIEVAPRAVVVGKILKVFSAGAGQREYEMQKLARSAVGPNKSVRVPKAHFFKKLVVTNDRFQNFLESIGVNTEKKKKNVEMLAMECIQGKDLDQFAYEQFILAYADSPQFSGTCPDKSWKEYFRTTSKTELKNFILDRLDLPVSNWADKAVMEGLRGRQLLPPELYDNSAAAIASLHRAGVYHRDLHPGNIMIENEEADPSLCLIDFGTAVAVDPAAKSGRAEAEIYEGYLSDERVLGFLKALTEKSEPKKLDDILKQLDEEF